VRSCVVRLPCIVLALSISLWGREESVMNYISGLKRPLPSFGKRVDFFGTSCL